MVISRKFKLRKAEAEARELRSAAHAAGVLASSGNGKRSPRLYRLADQAEDMLALAEAKVAKLRKPQITRRNEND